MKNEIMKNLILSSLIVALIGCSNSKKSTPTEITDEKTSQINLSQGFQLLEASCFSCHSPDASIENRIAPPMEGIKTHYIDDETTKEQFTRDLIAFLNDPIEEESKMPGAIKRFGVMPKMIFSDEQITNIAHYIYDTELEKPEWFKKHYQEERAKHKNDSTALTPIKKGLKFAMQAKSTLGKNLIHAINTEGTEKAMSFCSVRAYPLIDSVANSLHIKIKRVSDKNRNPKNSANQQELEYIMKSKNIIAKGQKPKSQMTEMGGKMVGYYPIMTNKMCLQCHGNPNTEIAPKVLSKIETLYPDDKAIGYAENELRGILIVEMAK